MTQRRDPRTSRTSPHPPKPAVAPGPPVPQPLPHNRSVGAQGEALAAEYLQAQGCEILDRNWRAGRQGELDLVVRDRGSIVAVEVKTRSGSGYGSPFEAITARKASRLRRLLLEWVRAHRPVSGTLRIDAVAVMLVPGRSPAIEHLRGIA